MRNRLWQKGICLFLCLLLLAPCAVSCAPKSTSLTQNRISSLTVDAKGNLQATVKLNSVSLEDHKGQMLRLYELLPGETTADISEKEPVAEKKVAAEARLSFPLTENDRTRLYSSFVLRFSDGTLLSDAPTYVQNPEALATVKTPLLWTGSPKGASSRDSVQAWAMGATAVMAETSLTALLSGIGGQASFADVRLSLCADELYRLDDEIRSASRLGMQVSLTVTANLELTPKEYTALFHFLASRYNGGQNGTLSAIYLDDNGSCEPQILATAARIARTALVSNLSAGRIYIATSRTELKDAKDFFASVKSILASEGGFEWGMAVRASLPQGIAVWDASRTDALTVHTLGALWTSVSGEGIRKGSPSRLTLLGVTPPANDTAWASYAYLYRAAIAAGAGTVFLNGNLPADEKGKAIFSTLDRGLSTDLEASCARIVGDAWTNLASNKVTHKAVTGVASTDNGGFSYDGWIDFTDGSCHDFSAVNGLYAPESRESASFGKPVLYTWVDAPFAGAEVGVSRVLQDARALEGAVSLSTQVLLQLPASEDCNLILRLRGQAKNGSVLTYESHVTVPAGRWQTVTFSIANFTSTADLSAPCVLTLVTDSTLPSTEEKSNAFVFWLKDITLRHPQKTVLSTIALPLTLAGVVLGFAATVVIYRLVSVRRRRRRA